MADLSYEKIIARLEQILKELENPGIELSQSLSLFEEGIILTTKCNKLLDEVQQKVKVLLTKDSGEIIEQDFKIQE